MLTLVIKLPFNNRPGYSPGRCNKWHLYRATTGGHEKDAFSSQCSVFLHSFLPIHQPLVSGGFLRIMNFNFNE
ncbi:MAG TPA: hypothetical protein DCR43_01520 [Bacteroidales bacterium]|nr:MAG: hypothetical protein A2X11_10735 [Bacteroidetes bacterium GWE2_42_24]OFY28152.1 MAG: hypothetical protein A2X09_00990 [Bacteroidetes bacterium GWF2_43_11]HAQ64529.1 hypothetical protein [Bacteroidales bacterium]HBZ65534.1 hypothetical protein [Bacteroidales bacterium]